MKTAVVALMVLVGQATFAIACPMLELAGPAVGPTKEHPPFARTESSENPVVLYIDPRSKFCACGIDPAVLQHFLADPKDAGLPADGDDNEGNISPK